MGLFGPPNVKKLAVKSDVMGLIAALGYQRERLVREEAALALGLIGDARAVEPLVAALTDIDECVRKTAEEVLGKMGLPAVAPLIIALRDGCSDVRKERAANILAKIGDVSAVEPLVTALMDSDGKVREAMVDALVKIGSPAVSPLIDVLQNGDWRKRKAAAEVLRKIGAPAVPALVEGLRNSDRSSDGAAAEVLGEIGDVRAVQPLIDVLGSRSMSKSAVIALGKLRDIRAVEPLIAKLGRYGRYDSEYIEEANALGMIGDARAVEPLIALLQNGLWESQIAAASALNKIGWQPGNTEIGATYFAFKGDWNRCAEVGMPAVALLISLIKQCRFPDEAAEALGNIGAPAVAPLMLVLGTEDLNSHIVHAAAKHALAKIGTPAVAALIAALKDGNERQRKRAADALEEMRWQPDKDEKGAIYWIYEKQWESCVEIGASAVGPLIGVLTDRDSPVRPAAAQTLGKIGDPRSVDVLIATLTDNDSAVRSAAAEALGRIGNARCTDALVAALEVSWTSVSAAIALGKMGDVRALDVLIASFKENCTVHTYYDGSRYGRPGMAEEEVLVMLGAQAVEPLVAVLNNGTNYACLSAARALGQIGDPRAVNALIAKLDLRDLPMLVGAADALKEMGWLPGNDEVGVRYWFAHKNWEKCAEMGAIFFEPLGNLIKFHPHWGGIGAVEALMRIGDARVVEPLIAALNTNDWEAAKAAFDGLGQIGDYRAVEPLIACLNGPLRYRQAAASSLVSLYRSGPLDEAHKQLILAQRNRITEPVRHVLDEWSDNPNSYDDFGIGVAFPV